MELKPLGETGMGVPEIGLGTWRYTGGAEPLRAGVDLGAWLIDTGEMYGTEEAVGQAIRDIRHQVFLATKVSPSHFGYEDVLQAADQSLGRLGTDDIDLYQLHGRSTTVSIAETMGAMEELVDAGKVRFIGVSNLSVAELMEAQQHATRYPIVSNQIRYHLADRQIEADLIPYCRAHGITVIACSPLAEGLAHLQHRDRDGALGRVAFITGMTEAQVALSWCVRRPGVIAIPKANSVEHVQENCHASGIRLSNQLALQLDQAFPRHIWRNRA